MNNPEPLSGGSPLSATLGRLATLDLQSNRPGVRLLRQRETTPPGTLPVIFDVIQGIQAFLGGENDQSANTEVQEFGQPGPDAPTFDLTDPSVSGPTGLTAYAILSATGRTL